MSSHVNINYQYSAQDLLDAFNSATKVPSNNSTRLIADLGEEAYSLELLAPFFEKFSFIPKNDNSLTLCQFVDKTRPHINPDNNGILVFPISGSLSLNKYSYVTNETDENGRPVMDFLNLTEEEIAAIEATKSETFVIDAPIAIDGLSTYSLEPTAPDTIVFVLKIHRSTSWENAQEMLSSM
jgi:hypothetical protein